MLVVTDDMVAIRGSFDELFGSRFCITEGAQTTNVQMGSYGAYANGTDLSVMPGASSGRGSAAAHSGKPTAYRLGPLIDIVLRLRLRMEA